MPAPRAESRPLTQYLAASSIDGFIADEHDNLDWLLQFDDPGFGGDDANPYEEFIKDIGPIAMGATTYEWVQRHYPDEWMYGDRPTWVFTHRELSVAPVTLGQGAPLLPRRRTQPMKLMSVRSARNGTFAHLRYSLR